MTLFKILEGNKDVIYFSLDDMQRQIRKSKKLNYKLTNYSFSILWWSDDYHSNTTRAGGGRWLSFLSLVLILLRMGNWIEKKFWSNLLVSLANFLAIGFVLIRLIWNVMNLMWLDYDCITMNWIVFGLNCIASLKYLEMTFVMILFYVNKTELCWVSEVTAPLLVSPYDSI